MSEDDTLEHNKRARDQRIEGFERILTEQFRLSYFGHISYEASESMTVYERHSMYNILIKQKKDERTQQEEAMKAAKMNRVSKGNSNRGRRR